MAFKDRLAQALRESGMTQTALAVRCEASPATVSFWLRGAYEPSRPMYDRLLDALPGLRENRESELREATP